MALKLGGTDYGSVFCAAGGRGPFGIGYWFHWICKFFGLVYENCGLITKTATFYGRLGTPEEPGGNMPMKEDGVTPKEWFPRCILPNFGIKTLIFSFSTFLLSIWMLLKGITLNAVGLSGKSFGDLLKTGNWQAMTEPFILSVMPVATTPEGRILEIDGIMQLLKQELPNFHAPVAIELNLYCPNVKKVNFDLVGESKGFLKRLSSLGIPEIVKLSIMAPIKAVVEISQDPNCHALDISNTVHWDDLEEVGIDRKKMFFTDVSPLAEYGGGGLSGEPLRPLVIDYIRRLCNAGCTKPIIAGGGILKSAHANDYKWHCPSSVVAVTIGCASMIRFWRVKSIIKAANWLFTMQGITRGAMRFK